MDAGLGTATRSISGGVWRCSPTYTPQNHRSEAVSEKSGAAFLIPAEGM